MDMGFPITQLSEAKFVIGVRVFISIRDQAEPFVHECRGVAKPLCEKKTVVLT